MTSSVVAAKKLLKDSQIAEARGETDTIRLWEGYREQAIMWRALALLQIPATFVALVAALIFWFNMEITLNVPPRPLPGLYSATELPREVFIENATNFVNLVATYQPAVAQRQYLKAREMVTEPFLTQYDEAILRNELKTIVNTTRTQVFFLDPTKTEYLLENGTVRVSFVGERMRYIAGKQLPRQKSKYVVSMTTLPNNEMNPYGIMVNGLSIEDLPE